MTNEELERKLNDLERKVDSLRANSLQQNATVIATASIRTKGTPSGDYYEIGVDDSNPALPVLQTINVGKKGT